MPTNDKGTLMLLELHQRVIFYFLFISFILFLGTQHYSSHIGSYHNFMSYCISIIVIVILLNKYFIRRQKEIEIGT
jgi:purine-cytosine permease-like protein